LRLAPIHPDRAWRSIPPLRHNVSVERTVSAQDEQSLVEEAQAVRDARLADAHRLSAAERLERLHALCAQVAALAPARGLERP